MHDSTKRPAIVGAAALVAATLLLAGTFAPVTPAVAESDADADAPALQNVTWFDGSTWKAVSASSGTYEGPAGGASATARMKADLGGPKTYFILAGETSDLSITIARPRFRFTGDAATAKRIQLAQFEVKEGFRRTPIEIGAGAAIFKKGVELEVTKVSNGLYEAKPKKSLEAGEYALATSESAPLAAFTIVERGY